MNPSIHAFRIVLFALAALSMAPLAAGTSGAAPPNADWVLSPAVVVQSTTKEIAESQALAVAKDKLVAYFRDEFMKSQEFDDAFGAMEWADISAEVIDSIKIARDLTWERVHYKDKYYAYSGKIWGIYAEVAVDKATGEARNVYLEIQE
jgi:hypothetical protein